MGEKQEWDNDLGIENQRTYLWVELYPGQPRNIHDNNESDKQKIMQIIWWYQWLN